MAPTRRLRTVLWIVAALLAVGAAGYQRMTGPTRPLRGSFEAGGEVHRYRLPRAGSTSAAKVVSIPDPGPGFTGNLRFRRYPLDEPFFATLMVRKEGKLEAVLPPQPPAGKLEYELWLHRGSEEVQVPPSGSDRPVIRFKGDVPPWVLVPHILLMFTALLLGLRAGLAALFAPFEMKDLALPALVAMTGGGMLLGPMVQKFAFGAFWTGWPLGGDLTDTKTLVMWGAWLIVGAALLFLPKALTSLRRVLLLAAVVVMLGVYLIPHSMRGSQLDYTKLEDGGDPTEAIRTGD